MSVLKRRISFLVFATFIFLHSLFVTAYGYSSDALARYQNRLQELNDILKTNYRLSFDSKVASYEEMVDFYQSMSLSEFDDYIYSVHESDMQFGKNEKSSDRPKEEDAHSETQTQKYYYNGDNYLYAVFKIKSSPNGEKVYNSIESAGHKYDAYPAYKVDDYIYNPCNDARKCFVIFHCTKYLSPYLCDGDVQNVSCVFDMEQMQTESTAYDTLTPVLIKGNHTLEFDIAQMRKFPEIFEKKIFIYCFETDTRMEVSFKNESENFDYIPHYVSEDQHYSVYMISDEKKNTIADMSDFVYTREYNNKLGYKKIQKL